MLSSVSFGEERASVIIQKNTEVSLTSLVSPILNPKTGIETVYISQLYLGEGAKLYLNRPVTIDAKKIILKPKSTLHTLGNSLTIKTDVFDALHFDLSDLNLSEDQRKDLMGKIDTRSKEEKHNGKDGESKQGAASPGKNALSRSGNPPPGYYPLMVIFENAQGGSAGEAGGNGQGGRNGGDFTLYVNQFKGGYFDTRGGMGGRGGQGGKGGNGGSGYNHPANGADFDSAIWDNSGRQYQFFCDGGNGGEGGRGGNGGNGGNGGGAFIFYKDEDLSSERSLFILNDGGKGREGGRGGEGGESGAFGSVPIGRIKPGVRRYEHPQIQGRIDYFFDGNKGAPGTSGVRGEKGSDGAQGARQVQKYESKN